MTLQMLIPSLFDRARTRLAPASATSNVTPTPHTTASHSSPQYRLVVLTLASRADTIDATVRNALRSQRISPETATRIDRSGGYLLELDYVLRCDRSGRAALVHLVSTLGDTAGVRAIRWETAPNLAAR
ncbi:hypothetical protein [Pandoraea commovens]|uniref:Uncharacterized protein n=1 Tax=Pandoraea commovens TaxID=2508289 RepID=A0A5E4SP24_9BURK|nr:hypothetical protein [Pandoraea commovens]UVA77687.1 hypothetical protein NTU39_16445 [Pandoraea commovens]VVD76682.1 hypothetical protein PCO31010_00916 [Pandoraea commovens]